MKLIRKFGANGPGTGLRVGEIQRGKPTGPRSRDCEGGRGSGSSHVIVAVGIEASTPVGTASTVGGNTKVTEEGSGARHCTVAVGIEASTPACTVSTVVCFEANTPSLW